MNDKGLCSGDVVIYADRQGHHIALLEFASAKANQRRRNIIRLS